LELTQFPLRGRAGKRDGTRELVLSPLPYMIVYTVNEETVHVVRILHGAQGWP
jgi:toxin ParE1/3/4